MSKEFKGIVLLSCPFCGSKAEYLRYAGEENREHRYKVECMADNSDHHGKEGVSEDWCPLEASTDWCKTKEDAAEIWNTRQLEYKTKEFAREVIQAECWGNPMYCYEIQDLAEKLGLIELHIATSADVNDESDFEVGDKIYKFTKEMNDE